NWSFSISSLSFSLLSSSSPSHICIAPPLLPIPSGAAAPHTRCCPHSSSAIVQPLQRRLPPHRPAPHCPSSAATTPPTPVSHPTERRALAIQHRPPPHEAPPRFRERPPPRCREGGRSGAGPTVAKSGS
uniref:Uncharacterized protein n=1 Tax=Aegilops tauschii subsp. strangulata TaxID=200361 RepID=A0A453GPJ2_AEGTS